ncbi:hypothetical protein [Sphingobacterium hungaricum]|uniref:RNA polymerase alpha subunit C-terminal domain-containing protein n=1 Tax=Sphingobacterium hungaricum TaxID=2082723 RepID=A0A928V139_9SPHI|nr:hypothetical protein [Sphingobacterium hungaricum]MBE8714572.1 hypothetical protein [Sphingobacterium hungaricum]
MTALKTKRTCPEGYVFYKASDCNTCPTCEKNSKPTTGFLSAFSAPVRRALASEAIDSVEKLATYSEKEILKLHGIGKSSLPIFYKNLSDAGLSFKD